MNNRLYVEALPATVTESRLREVFAQKGQVLEVKLLTDATGRPLGRAFVTMATPEVAEIALKALHGYALDGRNLVVTEARPVEERTQGLIGHGFEDGIGKHNRVKERGNGNSNRNRNRPRPRSNRKRH